ncbi:MAG TPA: Spy/CpxP family protein refolding chaperone [Alphaproteobacteria bacterium]
MIRRFRPIGTPVAALAVATLLTAAVAAPTLAAAQTGPTAPAPPQRAQPQRGPENVEARITELRERLKITPAQMMEWNAVAEAMRDNAQSVRQLAQQRAQNVSAMTAVDDLRSYEHINEAHVEGMKKLLPPFEALYASMSDAQKKNADAVFAQFERPGRKAHRSS